jgi:hypothetical protein
MAPTGKPEIKTTCWPAWIEVEETIAFSTLSSIEFKVSA